MIWMPVVTLERENNYEANIQTGDAPHGRDGEEFHLDCLVTILRSCLTQDLDLKTITLYRRTVSFFFLYIQLEIFSQGRTNAFSDYHTHPSHNCKVWFNAVQQIQTDEVDQAGGLTLRSFVILLSGLKISTALCSRTVQFKVLPRETMKWTSGMFSIPLHSVLGMAMRMRIGCLSEICAAYIALYPTYVG